MRRVYLYFSLMTFLLLLCIPGTGLCSDDLDLIEETDCGTINWSRGIIRAAGIQAPMGKSLAKSVEQAETLALAEEAAREKLLCVLKKVRMDSSFMIGKVFAHDKVVMARIEEMVSQAKLIKKAYLSDGTTKVTFEMSLRGGLSQLVLPEEIMQIQSIKTVSSNEKGASGPKSDSPKEKIATESDTYSGLAVDVRGLKLQPTMYPKIYDEAGNEIYGSRFISREFAVLHGISRYLKISEPIKALPEDFGNLLIVNGLRTAQPGNTDIVISNADAARIRGNSRHLSFLKECRVFFMVE